MFQITFKLNRDFTEQELDLIREGFYEETGKRFLDKFGLREFLPFFTGDTNPSDSDPDDDTFVAVSFWFITNSIYDVPTWDDLDAIVNRDTIEDMKDENMTVMTVALLNIIPYINEILDKNNLAPIFLSVKSVDFIDWSYDDMAEVIVDVATGKEYEIPKSRVPKLRKR